MARKLQYPIRRHTRISEETNQKLIKRAMRLKITPAEAHRLFLEQALEAPDPAAVALLKKWVKKFSRKRKEHPADQNWNAINSLADETENYLADL